MRISNKTVSRIWTWAEPTFRHSWMNLCSSDNHCTKYSIYKKLLSMMMVTCIKQHLSDIWSSIHEKVKQHWGWVEKSVAYEKNAYIVSDRNVKIFKTLYNLKGTVMRIEKALIGYVFQTYPESFTFQLFIVLQ